MNTEPQSEEVLGHSITNTDVSEHSQGSDSEHNESISEQKQGFFGHPLGLLNLFGTELCERFSYYGMRAILIYYMYDTVANGGLAMKETDALVIMSLFGSLVYLSSIVGGWLADRVMGAYRGVLFGGIVITAGHIVLGLPLGVMGLLIALLLIVIGTGLLKTNVSVMVGALYSEGDPRRQGGFSLLVMSINIGAFISPLIVGIVSETIGYNTAFLIPAAMMIVAVILYTLMGKSTLKGIGREPVQPLTEAEKRRWILLGIVGVAALVALGTVLVLSNTDVMIIGEAMPVICTLIALAIFITLIKDRTTSATERSRVLAFIPLFLASAMFWAIAEQQSTTIALIADTQINNSVAGFHVPPSWYASVNPLVIIIGSPIFALAWSRLGTRQISIVAKMAVGLFLACAGFLVLAAAFLTTGSETLVSPLWVIAGLTLMTTGELFLSPTGLSATSLLAPKRHMSKMMSLWFISNALGQGIIALTAGLFNEAAPGGFYLAFALVALVVGGILLLLQGRLLSIAKGVR